MLSRWFLASLVLLAAGTALSVAVWVNREAWLPERVPVHWGWTGKPDGFAARNGFLPYLCIMPAVVAGLLLLSRALPWLSPESFKVDTFRPTYEYVFFLVTAMMLYLHAVTVLAYTEVIQEMEFVRWLMGGMLIVFAGIGNVLGKVQRNFWMGVRTPWTLASETVWIRTHRVAAWTFVGGSVVGLALLLLGVHPLATLGVILASALAPVFYSLWLYKRLEKEGRLDKPTTE